MVASTAYLEHMNMQRHQPTQSVASFILEVIKPFRWHMSIMFLTAIVWAVDISFRPYLLKLIINGATEANPQDIFHQLAIPVAGYFLMSFLLSTAHRLYDYCVSINMIPPMRKKIGDTIIQRLLEHSHHYYQNQFSGSLANKVNDLINSVPDILQILIDRFFSHGLALVIAIYALWQVNMAFALAMLAWAGLFLLVFVLFSSHFGRLSDKTSDLASAATGKIVDVLSNILSVRLFARQRQERATIKNAIQEAVTVEQKLQRSYFWIWVTYGNSFVLVQGILLYFLLKGRQQGFITVGDFALVLTINLGIMEFVWELAQHFSQYAKHLGKITQALRTATVPVEVTDKPDAKSLMVTKGTIVFENVQFHYKGAEPLFEKKCVTIPGGQKVGLVGYSGSGKTTFVNLILRLFDIHAGRILIDGQDIAEIAQASLRQAIGMIPQDPSLFCRTLMENIRYGRVEATDDEVIEAAKKAHANAFIARLPQGYHTLVGERGVKLSGGQRQRIAIARAALKDAPILILDEATSQLDSITESEIQDSMWDLMEGKTTLVIAHRLSTLLYMDRILVFDKGKIVQDGAHKSLLEKGGLYKTLWDAQVGGFLPEEE